VRALVLVLLAACGASTGTTVDAPAGDATSDGGVDPAEGARSGSRLKLTWFELSDGTRQWDGFYDYERKEACYPYPAWTDGHVYCTPESNGAVVYADASCAQKIGQVYRDPTCSREPPKYLLEWHEDLCTSAPAHLYLRGSQITPAQYWLATSEGTCAGPYATTSDDFFALGPEITPQSLVEVTVGDPVGTGRITERFWQGPDGMRLPTVLHDSVLDADCSPQTYVENGTTGLCMPTDTQPASYFHDAACTQAELGIARTCTAPAFAQYNPSTSCPADPPHVAAVGAATTSSPLFYWTGSSCSGTTGDATTAYYGLGADVSVATLQRAPDAVQSHRIQLVHYTADDLRFRDTALYDSQRGVTCVPTALPDGSTVCLPSGGSISTYYRDSACTQPVDLVEVYGGNGCVPPIPPTYARKYITPAPDSCQYDVELHPVSTPYAGALYSNHGVCAPYTPSGSTLYSVGPAVPTSDFVSATISIDP
jgi:hypothetical protein